MTKAIWLISAAAAAAVFAASCQNPSNKQNTPAKPTEPAVFPRASSWIGIMNKVIDAGFSGVIATQVERGADADFAAIIRAADDCADHMALGYGIHNITRVDGFDQMAREAEAWLRQISARAAARDIEGLAWLVENGAERHCDRCHAAAGG